VKRGDLARDLSNAALLIDALASVPG